MVESNINDPSQLMNVLRGGTVKWLNQCFGVSGNANDDGHPINFPPADGLEYTYWCNIMYNLTLVNVKKVRNGGHDEQAYEVFMAVGATRTVEAMVTMLKAARAYNIKVITTLGGFSDASTCYKIYDLFNKDSQMYKDFTTFAAEVADGLYDYRDTLELLELLNEPDFMQVVKDYWLKNFKSLLLADPLAIIKLYAAWVDQMIKDVKAKQKKPGVAIGMGTALDSNLYSDANGNARMDWLAEKAVPNVIKMVLAPCDKPSIHSYIGENTSVHEQVWRTQKLPAFVAAANALGKTLIVGETGSLWVGGTYNSGMDAVYQTYGNVEKYWMIRSWDPKIYKIPTTYPPETVIETPEPDTPATDPPASEDTEQEPTGPEEDPSEGNPEPSTDPVVEDPFPTDTTTPESEELSKFKKFFKIGRYTFYYRRD